MEWPIAKYKNLIVGVQDKLECVKLHNAYIRNASNTAHECQGTAGKKGNGAYWTIIKDRLNK